MPVQSITDRPGPLPGEHVDPRVTLFAEIYGPVLDHWGGDNLSILTTWTTVEGYGFAGASITSRATEVTFGARWPLGDGFVRVIAATPHPVTIMVPE